MIRKDKWLKFNVRELLFLAKAETESRSNYVENCYNWEHVYSTKTFKKTEDR